MKTTIGIFRGKQAENNIKILKILYENGPLTVWGITGFWGELKNRHSLHATLNKRLRALEKKGYVQKAGKLWCFRFKGIIATLLIQPQPKPWNQKWTKIFEDNYMKPLKQTPKKYAITEDDKKIADLTEFAQNTSVSLRSFGSWVALANWVKKKMEEGFINLDVINDKSLLLLIISEFNGSQIRDVGSQYGINIDSLGDEKNGSR